MTLNGDKDSSLLLESFLATGHAASSASPLVGVRTTERLHRRMMKTLGTKTHTLQTPENQQASKRTKFSAASLPADFPCVAGTDCIGVFNNSGQRPSIPTQGKLQQIRMQGVIEYTNHEFSGLSKSGYPRR